MFFTVAIVAVDAITGGLRVGYAYVARHWPAAFGAPPTAV